MVQANYCHCPSEVALQLPAASAIFVGGREGEGGRSSPRGTFVF